MFCIKWFDRKGVFSDHPWRQYKCIFCEEELQENCILKEHMWLLRMLDVFNGIYLWMFVQGKLICMFCNKKFYWNWILVYPVLMCHGEKSFEVLNECFHDKGIYFSCRNCNLEFCSHANLKYHIALMSLWGGKLLYL